MEEEERVRELKLASPLNESVVRRKCGWWRTTATIAIVTGSIVALPSRLNSLNSPTIVKLLSLSLMIVVFYTNLLQY